MTDYGHIDLWDIRDELQEPKMQERYDRSELNDEELYKKVKEQGFSIDSRSVNPLLIKGQWARSFNSFREACNFALFRFDTEQ